MDLVRAALGSAPTTQEELERRGIALVPEISAAVAGFANSTKRDNGLYALVDVGAGTVDCCTFGLGDWREEGEIGCPIFMADVAMLGVEPWRSCQDDAELAAFFEKKVAEQQRGVIWDTRQRRHRSSERWRTGLPVFLLGGGAASDMHRRVTAGLDAWLRRSIRDGGGARVRALSVPEEELRFDCRKEETHRLAVAFGLSFPFGEIPKAELPRSIDDDVPARRRDIEASYVSKEMT